jgi:hypothetical protein
MNSSADTSTNGSSSLPYIVPATLSGLRQLVDDKVEALVTSLSDRQRLLQSAWLGADTGPD